MSLNAIIPGQAIALVLLVLFCMKYVWPSLMAAIEKRQKEIADGLASTERMHKDLDLAEANVIDQLKKAKAETQVIIEQTNKRHSQILDGAKAEAEQGRIRIAAQAQAETEAERKHVREKLHKQVAILTVTDAGEIIEHSVNRAASNDIVDKFVAELQEGRG